MKMKRYGLMLALIVINSSCVGGQSNPFPYIEPNEAGISKSNLDAIDQEINEWLASNLMVGGELLIVKDGYTIFHQTYGWMDRENAAPWQTNTICRIRSMTKPIVGMAVLMLVERGDIALTDKVSQYLSAFNNDRCRDITIDQLLTHTGGFTQPGYPNMPWNYANLRQLVEMIGAQGPRYTPGTRYAYSDGGVSTLAYLVTVVSGMEVEDFIQEQIVAPLEMNSSFCNLVNDDRRSRIGATYESSNGQYIKYWDNTRPQLVPYFRGSGGVYSTTTDYACLLAMWMNMGIYQSEELLSRDSIKLALTPTRHNDSYGRLWHLYNQVDSDDACQIPIFGHGGSDGTVAWANPEHNLIVCYFTQSRGGRTPSMIRSLIRDNIVPGPVENLSNYESYDSIQYAIDKAQTGDTLILQPGIYPEPLEIDKDIVLVSLDPNDPFYIGGTIIQGDLSKPVVTLSNNSAACTLAGLTLRAGSIGISGTTTQATIRNCRMMDNTSHGIELFEGSNPHLNQCLITANGQTGITMHPSSGRRPLFCQPTIEDCVIVQNDQIALEGGEPVIIDSIIQD
jgi:CubicO group peptidase (beta-lactamase class C family)